MIHIPHSSGSSSYRGTASPRPGPSQLSRPQWPWSRSTSHRPSSSSSSSHHLSSSGSPAGGGFAAGSSSWDHGYYQHPSASSAYGAPDGLFTSTKQWTFTAFEWTIDGVAALRDFVESAPPLDNLEGSRDSGQSDGEDVPELLKEFPILGDGRFKLEIARTALPDPINETAPDTPTQSAQASFDQTSSGSIALGQTLSLFITSLMVDFANTGYENSASMMAAIKSHEEGVGERGMRSDWVWETWEQFTFRKNSEVWECALPPLSSLLENPRISASDSFVLCLQIHSPVGPFFPHHPSAYYVPRDLLEGVEASLDNAHTGDVRFICLERLPQTNSPPGSAQSHRPSSEPSSFNRDAWKIVRKRVIYAHSDILKRRCDYFNAMLSSSFAESTHLNLPLGERRMFDIVVEEADFVTVYWLLKWVYGNWLLFKEEDDPRDAVTSMGGGWSAKWLAHDGRNEWEPRSLVPSTSTSDTGSVTSLDSSPTSPPGRDNGKGPVRTHRPGVPALTVPPRTSPSTSSPSSSGIRRGSNTVSPKVGGNRSAAEDGYSTSSTVVNSKPGYSATTPTQPAQPPPASTHGPSRQTRTPFHSTTDPNPHPTPSPPPASALSIYLLAHRYGMMGLSSLAMEHTMNTITPRTGFPLLLATHFWEELRVLIEDYVVDRWDEVSRTEEFDVCCQEIAAGDWGQTEGGATLSALFRRLHRPGSSQASA